MIYNQREIVLVPFPYSDLSSAKKKPVLIVSNNTYNKSFPDILVCAITSNSERNEYSIFLADADLEVGILPETSVIKFHKFTVQQSKILKRFSFINETKFDEVVRLLNKLIDKSN